MQRLEAWFSFLFKSLGLNEIWSHRYIYVCVCVCLCVCVCVCRIIVLVLEVIDIQRKYRLLKVCYEPSTSAAFLAFLLQPLTILMRQTWQPVRTINQSIFLRCL
jgi:hypothetical protein